MSKEDQRIHPYPIRLTKELREKLEAVAKANGRSLNAEMLLRLEASLQEEEEQTPADSPALTAEDVRRLVLEVVREETNYEGGILGTLKAIAKEEPPKTLRGTWQNFKEKMALGLRHAETLNIWKEAIKVVGYTPPPAVAEGIKAMIFAEKIESQHVVMLLQAMKEAEIQQKDDDPTNDIVPAI